MISLGHISDDSTKKGNKKKKLYLKPKSKNKKLVTNKFEENLRGDNDRLEKIYIPHLPEFNWSVNKDYLSKNVLFNLYFIS